VKGSTTFLAGVNPVPILRYLADLAATATSRSGGNPFLPDGGSPEMLDVTRTGEPPEWLGTSVELPLIAAGQGRGAATGATIQRTDRVRQLATAAALQPTGQLLRLGWVLTTGTVSVDDRAIPCCFPLVSQPVRIMPGGFSDDRDDVGGSEIEAGRRLTEAAGGHGVHIALAQDDVVVAADLDLVAVLRVEQHVVAGLHGPDVRADGNDLGPRQTLGHLRRRRDEDAARRLALTLARRHRHQHAVVEHLDRELVVTAVGGFGGRLAIRRGRLGHVSTLPSPLGHTRLRRRDWMLTVRG
jgi:hypothetical protein